jgi:hypothetical protein
MIIPDDMIPELAPVATAFGPSMKLPPMSREWGGRSMKQASPEEKAGRYLEEACRSLALARYWAERAE